MADRVSTPESGSEATENKKAVEKIVYESRPELHLGGDA